MKPNKPALIVIFFGVLFALGCLSCGGAGNQEDAGTKTDQLAGENAGSRAAKGREDPGAKVPATEQQTEPFDIAKAMADAEAEAAAKTADLQLAHEAEVERLKALHRLEMERFRAGQEEFARALSAYQAAKALAEARKFYATGLKRVQEIETAEKLLQKTNPTELATAKVMLEIAKEGLQEVMKRYPDTQAAGDAKTLLEGGKVEPLPIPNTPPRWVPLAEPELVLPPPPEPVAPVYPPVVQEYLASKAEAARKTAAKATQERKYIPGLFAVDVHGNFTNRGFALKTEFSSTQTLWKCDKETATHKMRVEVFGESATRITLVRATYLNYSADDTDQGSREFMAYAATIPYDGSDPATAKQWVESNIGRNATTTIGGVTFELIANPDVPRFRILLMRPTND